ncbi:tRNA pseudouridine38/39 synthase [Apostasia shenzhenica]|uniref:tRNA pseudouridine38/39 synthase n=1 Tax=Apostasia shenzhenica TaxID=1088818 RepID=A0A2I0BAA7_9ASPA|nr:tRNA pseudouridine38/39 synthase [Apostasia shenzhenica]
MNNKSSFRYFTHCDMIISHLAYADDYIIFCNGSRNVINSVFYFLNCYQRCSGKKINKGKSGFICSKNASKHLISRWQNITQFNHISFPFNYLGCPINIGNMNNSLFDSIFVKVRSYIGGWENKLLSKGAKLILINYVLCAIPLTFFRLLLLLKLSLILWKTCFQIPLV